MDFIPFSEDEIKIIKTILDENPLILASIMNGNLSDYSIYSILSLWI